MYLEIQELEKQLVPNYSHYLHYFHQTEALCEVSLWNIFLLEIFFMKHLPLSRDNKILRMGIRVKIMILQNKQLVRSGNNHGKFNWPIWSSMDKF